VTVAETPRITRDELEQRFRALQDDLRGKASDRKDRIVAIAAGAAVAVAVVSYLLGRRSGRRRGSRVEIRRF
jgi:hypothetical protein